ncbi:MAG: TadE/TadG family type IV pilus assembly protein [Pseudomonadota bacterium]
MTGHNTRYRQKLRNPAGVAENLPKQATSGMDSEAVRPSWQSKIRHWLRDESGATLVEFTIIVPTLFMVFFLTAEFSYLKVREVALDRSTDRAFRELRLGLIDDPTHDKMKIEICSDELAFLLPNCLENLLLEVREVPKTDWSINTGDPICLDTTPAEDYEPPIVFTAGVENQMMVARACLIQRSIFPVFELVRSIGRYDEFGNFALISKTAFVNEPS